MSAVAGTTNTETLSNEGSSCVLELSEGRFLRIRNGLKAALSTDGSTWESIPVIDDQGQKVVGGINFSLCRLKSGNIAVLYNCEEQLPGRPENYGSYFRTSADEGKTWSSETRIDFVEGIAWAWHDTMTVMLSGRIVIPFRAINGSTYTRPTLLPGYGNIDGKRVAIEGHAHAPEMDIGFVMYSDDEGETWSMPEPSQLSSSYSPARLRTVPGSGDLICVWNQVSMREIDGKWTGVQKHGKDTSCQSTGFTKETAKN